MPVLQKRCTKCGVRKPWTKPHYHKQGKMPDGSPRYASVCADCRSEYERSRYKTREGNPAKHADYVKARSAALTRLKSMHPKDYQLLYREEATKIMMQRMRGER